MKHVFERLNRDQIIRDTINDWSRWIILGVALIVCAYLGVGE